MYTDNMTRGMHNRIHPCRYAAIKTQQQRIPKFCITINDATNIMFLRSEGSESEYLPSLCE